LKTAPPAGELLWGFAMRRLGNARTILEIEAIAAAARGGPQEFRWMAGGVECTRASHRHSGPDHSVTIDVLTLRHRGNGRPWHLILVSELWRAGAVDLRATRWLKLVAGRQQDVLSWLAECGEPATAINPPPAKELTP
jgi:hypothetical protein